MATTAQPKSVLKPVQGTPAAPAKPSDAFGGRKVSPKIAAVATTLSALQKKQPPVLPEILIGVGLGLAGGMIWKMYHLSWRKRVTDLQEGLDEGYFTTEVLPNSTYVRPRSNIPAPTRVQI